MNLLARVYGNSLFCQLHRYFLTSFEAAVEYVRNEAQQLATMNVSASGINTTKFKRLRSNSTMADEEGDPIKMFFKSICNGDVEAVKDHLQNVQSEHAELKAKMCHPLCNCKECTTLQERLVRVRGRGRRDHVHVVSERVEREDEWR